MKHLVKISAISALLLTINGCVTVETSHDTPLIAELGEVIIVDSYEELDMSTYGDETYKVEAMSTTSGEKFFYRHWAGYYKQAIGSLRNRALLACRDVFNSDCVITRAELATAYGNTTTYDEDIFYTSLEDYKNKQETRLVREREIEETRLVREREIEEKRRFNIEQHNIRQAKYQREEKERMIAELRDRCASYGFSGDENIAACVQREAQHDLELAQQERALRLAQQRLANQNRQAQVQTQIVEEEVPWWLQFLADVAEGVAEGYAHDAIYHNDKPKVIYRNCDVYQC
jgi:hypothetical protein